MMNSLVLMLALTGCLPAKAVLIDENPYPDDDTSIRCDVDGDGFCPDEGDCDDSNAEVHPDAAEICDGIDNDCDTLVDADDADIEDATTWYVDGDGDGFGGDGTAHLRCDAPTDGFSERDGDCDDAASAINPDADEVCDDSDVDEDCDGFANDADDDAVGGDTYYVDGDGDGYGDNATAFEQCTDPGTGFASQGDDCDDSSVLYNPGALENDCADPNDYNCDGSVGYADADGDTFPACQDCNDDPANGGFDINPDAQEVCDPANVDENCSGDADDDDPSAVGQTEWFDDADGDGYGDPDTSFNLCDQPVGTTLDDTDCDDSVAAVNPGATEVCDGGPSVDTDEDCNSLADDLDPGVTGQGTWYADSDGDGYGDPSLSTTACDQPASSTTDNTDCDDGDGAINPGAIEVCDGGPSVDTDEDCNGSADDLDPGVSDQDTWYADTDGDGFGDPGSSTDACDQPASHVLDNQDCDDGDGAINPDADEVCDPADTDEDCNGSADDSDGGVTDQGTWYTTDADGDGYGTDASVVIRCDQLAAVAQGGDCDDGNSGINPGAAEVCDPSDEDEDCNGVADNNDPGVTGADSYYADLDFDGVGDLSSGVTLSCEDPGAGYELHWDANGDGSTDADDGDCDDNANYGAHSYPGNTEIQETVFDDDCDGFAHDDGTSYSAQEPDGSGSVQATTVQFDGDNLVGDVEADAIFFNYATLDVAGDDGTVAWDLYVDSAGAFSTGDFTVSEVTSSLIGYDVPALAMLGDNTGGVGINDPCVGYELTGLDTSADHAFAAVFTNTGASTANVWVFTGTDYTTHGGSNYQLGTWSVTAGNETHIVAAFQPTTTTEQVYICSGLVAPNTLYMSHVWIGEIL